MGHTGNTDQPYHLLQRRLDRNITGAPYSPTFMKILKLLFSPEEAQLARRLPSQPKPIDALSNRLDIPQDQLCEKLTEMAHRGVVLDLEYKGTRYFALPPVIIGFFEFTFMRARDELPMAELAQLFDQYMHENDKFNNSVFTQQTQIGRSLVNEESLHEGDYVEILDWERASHIVSSASATSVGICQCRHKASHLGKACDKPQRTCLTLNYAAESMARNGHAQPITTNEAMSILEECKESGLAQIGDNVQRNLMYICNCCGCCCGMMDAIRTFNIRNAIVSSNWIRIVDLANCKGCGKCAEACPVNAIEIVEEMRNGKKKRWAVCDDTLCLGCGVCYAACKFGGIIMNRREKMVYTPETAFDRIVSMAIERGKLANILFDNPEKLSHRALGRIVSVLENSPPFKAAMAVKPLRSAFLSTMVKGAKRSSGEITEILG